MEKDLYKVMRLEQLQEEGCNEAEADLIIEKEISDFEEWLRAGNIERG